MKTLLKKAIKIATITTFCLGALTLQSCLKSKESGPRYFANDYASVIKRSGVDASVSYLLDSKMMFSPNKISAIESDLKNGDRVFIEINISNEEINSSTQELNGDIARMNTRVAKNNVEEVSDLNDEILKDSQPIQLHLNEYPGCRFNNDFFNIYFSGQTDKDLKTNPLQLFIDDQARFDEVPVLYLYLPKVKDENKTDNYRMAVSFETETYTPLFENSKTVKIRYLDKNPETIKEVVLERSENNTHLWFPKK